MTDPIKAKIQKLCPDVITEHSVQCDMDTSHGYITPHEELGCEVRDITLAVVLRAILKSNPKHDDERMISWEEMIVDGYGVSWNLEHDNYDQQSEECKQFIGNLLGV